VLFRSTVRLQQGGGEAAPPNVVLNLSAISYLNSSNLAQLLRLRKTLAERSGRLKLASVADPVWSIMLLTGLDKVFQFAPDKATAIASLQLEQG
jgi:anti-anti-sigma factor